jgi:hypothetical protein
MPAYTAKAAAAATKTKPDEWPDNWPYPNGGALPPGYVPTYTVTLSTDATVYASAPGSTITDPDDIEVRILDDNLPTNDFLTGSITVSATVGETVVQLREVGGGSFQDSIELSVSEVVAGEWGADASIEFNPDISLDGETMTLNAAATYTGDEIWDADVDAPVLIAIDNLFYSITMIPDNNFPTSDYFVFRALAKTANYTTETFQLYDGQFEDEWGEQNSLTGMFELNADGDTSVGNWTESPTGGLIFGSYVGTYWAKQSMIIRSSTIDLSQASSITLKLDINGSAGPSLSALIELRYGDGPGAGTLVASTTYNFTSTGIKTITLL